jgi:NFU1 iron-sulfur cluster scaffold homolog, mitochondrial
MMDVQIFSQWTPNPNAYKFIVSDFVIAEGKAGFSDEDTTDHIPLVRNLLSLEGVVQVHLYENVITITQNGSCDWGELNDSIENVITMFLPQHNPQIERKKKSIAPHLEPIDEIIERTIRPGLQGDGGDLELVDYEDHVLSIRYEGACGSCPSSLAGTLQAIQGILRDEYDPDIEVVVV